MPTGEKLYLEQTSHIPAITNFLLEGPNESYKLYGFYQIKGWLTGPNSLAGCRDGDVTLEFKDGTVYKYENPNLVLNNLIAGT